MSINLMFILPSKMSFSWLSLALLLVVKMYFVFVLSIFCEYLGDLRWIVNLNILTIATINIVDNARHEMLQTLLKSIAESVPRIEKCELTVVCKGKIISATVYQNVFKIIAQTCSAWNSHFITRAWQISQYRAMRYCESDTAISRYCESDTAISRY